MTLKTQSSLPTDPKVTIGLPFSNQGVQLAQALRSVFAQTYSNWQLLLVDDGSSDAAAEIAAGVRDPRVRLVRDGRNLGLATRLNEITRMAEGDLVCRMDADDVMVATRLERQVARFVARPQLDVLGSRAYALDEEGHILGLYREPEFPETRKACVSRVPFTHPTVMARRDWFVANPYRENLRRSQDKDLWVRTWQESHKERLTDELLFYRLGRVPSLTLYRSTCKFERSSLRSYRGDLISKPYANFLLTRSVAKEWVFDISIRAGRGRWLNSRRVATLSEEASSGAQSQLNLVNQTKIPGLDF